MSHRKLRELILYVLSRQAMDRVKLGNLLYLADLETYHKLGASITGATYVKKPWGAEPRNFGHILGAMRRYRQIEPADNDGAGTDQE